MEISTQTGDQTSKKLLKQEDKPIEQVLQEPVVQEKTPDNSVIHLLKGFRDEAELRKRFAFKLLVMFSLIFIFDLAVVFYTVSTIVDPLVSYVSTAGLYFLLASVGYSIMNLLSAKKRIKNIDEFYLEISMSVKNEVNLQQKTQMEEK